MQVIVILQSDPASSQGGSSFKAVALDREAALRWVQDEVDQKHDTGHQYMQGKNAEWWINEYPVFELRTVDVEMGYV